MRKCETIYFEYSDTSKPNSNAPTKTAKGKVDEIGKIHHS